MSACRQELITPRACARGKTIGFVCCRHKNRQIWTSRHLSDSQAQRIRQNRRKTGFTVLRIVWHGARTSQIACFVGHAYRPHIPQAMCFLLMRTTAKYMQVKVVNRHSDHDQCIWCSARGMCSSYSCDVIPYKCRYIWHNIILLLKLGYS